jgi:TolB-like protein/Tfp pilus assembly protein PilF
VCDRRLLAASFTSNQTPVPTELVREHLVRIVESELFRRSERLIRFLKFSVQAALNGDSARVKEYVVGVEVFDRGQTFDPRVDPVVRVEARRLRNRLRQWHETVGRDSALVIDLPTGAYAAEIRYRPNSPVPIAIAAPAKKIAVLPFANLNADVDLDYFSDGLTEELIHGLTRLKGLQVVAWPSASRLKGQEQDVAAIRDRLQVQNILRGSVRRFGDRLRMTAQLIDTSDGHYLWSEAWDRAASDLLAIEQEIARAIVAKLSVDLEPSSAFPPSRDAEAHTLYLKGRFQLNKRSPASLRFAVEYFKQAAGKDPEWPLAWAGLADAYALLATYGVCPAAPMMSAAKDAAQRALTLDPTRAEAFTCLAFVRGSYEWKWQESEDLYRRAIELNPGYAVAHHWYGSDCLGAQGRLEEASAELEIAISLDPLSSILLDGKGFLLMLARRFDEACQVYTDLLQYDPEFYKSWGSLGRMYTQMGRYSEAIEMFQKARSMAGDYPRILGALGQTFGLAGQPDKARELLAHLEIMSKSELVGGTTFALIHLGLGEREAALQRLEAAVEEREISVVWLKSHPAWDALRSEPRLEALLERIGLP